MSDPNTRGAHTCTMTPQQLPCDACTAAALRPASEPSECDSVLEVEGHRFRCDLYKLHGGDHQHEFMEMAGPPRRMHFATVTWWDA